MIDAVFESKQAQQVIKYVADTYGDNLQFLWQKFPKNAIWRRKDNKKWYAALLVLKKNKLGLLSDEEVSIIDLRAYPDFVALFVDGKKYFPGYHMNKRNWFTIILDGTVPTEEICRHIDESYKLALD